MPSDICIFKRTEKKYLLTEEMRQVLCERILPCLVPDEHGRSTVCSLYLDTPSFLLIRNSIEAKTYKEKLRLRCYGIPKETDFVFLEIKKKFKGVVYKRRVKLPLDHAMEYIERGAPLPDSQIVREIDYAMHFYSKPQPAMLVAYERDAFFGREDSGFRITFDTNVRYRTDDLFLSHGNDGKTILPKDTVIMEIKTDGAMPLWLSHTLSELGIYPHSFSKYGTSYRDHLQNHSTQKGEIHHV